MCNAVWAAADSDVAERTAALKLGYGDYQDLAPTERVQVGRRGSGVQLLSVHV